MSDMGTCSPGAEGVSDGGEEQSRAEQSRAQPLHSSVQPHGTEQAVLTASSGSSTH